MRPRAATTPRRWSRKRRSSPMPGCRFGDDASTPTCITPATPQSCAPPEMTALPICKLSQTGCMDSTTPTRFVARAVYYEVNSPLWSDDAAKTRAFVLPDGGTIHVKDCMPDAGAARLAECVSPDDDPEWPRRHGQVGIPRRHRHDQKLHVRRQARRDASAHARRRRDGRASSRTGPTGSATTTPGTRSRRKRPSSPTRAPP